MQASRRVFQKLAGANRETSLKSIGGHLLQSTRYKVVYFVFVDHPFCIPA